MRRFIKSSLGKAVSLLTAGALLVPFFTFWTMARASAQIDTLPTWAVVEFANLSGKGGKYGKVAADAVAAELSKTNRYDIVPADTVDRTMKELGYTPPLTRPDELIRLGQSLQQRASSIVSGEVVDYRVNNSGNGKQASVVLRVLVRDVASGLSVNGAAVIASSSVRTGDATDETLINEAIAQAAFMAVGEIVSRTLPNATVLNTLERTALINQGTRSGFTVGQEVVVLRGREQVAQALVSDVEPDSAYVRVTRQTKGIQPGDKVRVVFTVPEAKGFNSKNVAKIEKPRRQKNNNNLVGLIIIVAILGFLLLNGHGSNNTLTSDVTAEALMLGDDTAAVQINWRTDAFAKGNQQRFRWQIWRQDVSGAPVLVVDGANNSAIDDSRGRQVTWYDFGGLVGGSTCQFTAPPAVGPVAGPGVVAGTPYLYSLELVYKVNPLDLPDGGNTGSTGSTTGGTTGGSSGITTGGGTTGLTGGRGTGGDDNEDAVFYQQTTGTTGTTGGTATAGGTTECFFVSQRATAKGYATPLNRPNLRTPEDNALVDPNVPAVFTFTSVKGAVNSVRLEYALQFSDDPNFGPNRTATIVRFVDNTTQGGTVSTPAVSRADLLRFPGAPVVYWRIGGKNLADVPGPIPINGERYIFSGFSRFRRPAQPPN